MKYFFKVNEDLVSRSLAHQLGLIEETKGLWYIDSPKTSESRRNLQSAFNHFKSVPLKETTSSSFSTVINPESKPMNQVGTLFGGSYKQKKTSTEQLTQEADIKFAGEYVGQKPGDQVRGTELAKKNKKQHPFKGRLVGGI